MTRSRFASTARSVSVSNKQAFAAFLVLFIRVIGIALQLVTLLVLSHLLPPEAFGLYATAYAVLAVVRVIGPIGLDQLALKGIFGHDDFVPDENQFGDALAILLVVNVGFAMLTVGGFCLIADEFAPFSIMFFALGLPAIACAGFVASVIRSFGHNSHAQWPESIGLPVILLVLISVFAYCDVASLNTCLIALALSAWATLVIYLFLLRSVAPLVGLIGSLRPSIHLISRAAPFTGALVVTAIASRLPVFLAAMVLGPAQAATVEVASRFGTIGTIITSSVATTFSPRFARAHEDGDVAAAGQLVRISSLFAGVSVVVLCIVLAIIFPFLATKLLPDYYISSHSVLICCCVATSINAAFGISSNYLLMAGRQKVVLFLSSIQLFAIALITIALAAPLGPLSIGLALICGAIIRDAGSFLFVHRYLGAATR